jgi:hypothetical protein
VRWLAPLLALVIAVVAINWAVLAAMAAIQLSAFTIESRPASVILRWSTVSEFNVAGFEVQCKRESEPDTSYHPIGTLASRGGPNVPASYEFPVTTGMVVGESYCFRLREITTDNTVGEMPTLCGYGPNVTPTPGAPGVPGALVPGQLAPQGIIITATPVPQTVIDPATGQLVTVTPGPPPAQQPGVVLAVFDPLTGLLVTVTPSPVPAVFDPVTGLLVTVTPTPVPAIIDPVTGQLVTITPTPAPAIIDPVTGQLVTVTPTPAPAIIDPVTGQLVTITPTPAPAIIDPATGLLVTLTPTPFAGQAGLPPAAPVVIDPITGLPVTATPTPAQMVIDPATGLLVTVTPTPVPMVIDPATGLLVTVTPIPPFIIDPLSGQQIPNPAYQPPGVPGQPQSPLVVPTPTATAVVIDPNAAPSAAGVEPPAGQQVDPFATATSTLMIDPVTGLPVTVTPTPLPPQSDAPPAQSAEAALALALTEVPMIVVTAVATPAPMEMQPTFTPWPTAVPTAAALQLVNLTEPSTQNIMLLLLCLTFAGAGGVGLLGLLTSIMFMRSRSSQRDFYERSRRKGDWRE